MKASTILLLSLLLVCTNCGGSRVGRGVALYREHNYIEAAEAFERTQNRLPSMQPVERVRYGLYRGLTLIYLGDLRGGERWLNYAETQHRAQPTLLDAEERTMLARGHVELDRQRQGTWPETEAHWTRGVAATTSGDADNSARLQ